MENIGYISEEERYLRQERCSKARKDFLTSVIKRLVIGAVLLWSVVRSGMPGWAVGLMGFALLLNLTGLYPKLQEWRERRKELLDAIAQME